MTAATPAPTPPPRAVGVSARAEAALVVGLLVLAASIRWIRWERTDAIFNDGPRFLAMAERMAADDWGAALGHDYHPLYPFLTVMARFVLDDMESAAVAVSVLGGVIAVGCIYGLARDTFDWPVAPIAALLLAVHPNAVDFTSDVQSEGVYLAAFLGSLWLGWRACRDRQPAVAAWAGALSGLAYLARPEGLGAILVAGALAAWFTLQRRWTLVQGLGWATAALAGTLLVMGPYLGLLRVQGGDWALTRKKSVGFVAGLAAEPTSVTAAAPEPGPRDEPGSGEGPAAAAVPRAPVAPAGAGGAPPPRAPLEPTAAPDTPAPEAAARSSGGATDGDPPPGPAEPARDAAAADDRAVERLESYTRQAENRDNSVVKRRNSVAAFRELLDAMTGAFRFEVLALVILGLVHLRGRPTDRGLYYGVLALVFGVVLTGLAWNVGYVSRRHVLPVAAALLGYAGVGVIVASRLVQDGLAGARPGWAGESARRGITAAIVLVLMIPPLIELSDVRREDKRAGRLAAQWLKEQEPAPAGLAARRSRLAYYAGAPFVAMPASPYGLDAGDLRANGASHVILEVDDLPPEALDRLLAQPGVDVLERFSHAGHEALVIVLGPGRGS